MTDELMLDGPTEDLDVFECPHCGQTIYTSADVCRFCGAKIDHDAALKAAHLLAKVDQACSDASVIKIMAGTAFCLPVGIVFGLLRNPRCIYLVGFQNVVLGFCVLVLILSSPFPIWSLRWWERNRHLTSEDEEFQNSRSAVRTVGSAAAASLLTFGSILSLVIIYKVTHR